MTMNGGMRIALWKWRKKWGERGRRIIEADSDYCMEKILGRKAVFKGKKIWVWEKRIDFGNGKKGVWEVAASYPISGASVLAIDDKNYIHLVRQFKPGPEKRIYTLPTGGVEKNETPLECAKKELHEEAGLGARKWNFLFKTVSNPGYTDATGHVFLARGLYRDPLPTPEAEETIAVKISFEKALRMVQQGQILDQRTALAILWYAHFKDLRKK